MRMKPMHGYNRFVFPLNNLSNLLTRCLSPPPCYTPTRSPTHGPTRVTCARPREEREIDEPGRERRRESRREECLESVRARGPRPADAFFKTNKIKQTNKQK